MAAVLEERTCSRRRNAPHATIPAWPRFTAQEMSDLIAYLNSL
jgi:hypothetical protein